MMQKQPKEVIWFAKNTPWSASCLDTGMFQDFNRDSSHAEAFRTVMTIVPE